MIGVKPLFSGRSLADGANADFDVVAVAPDGADAGAARPALRVAAHRDPLSVLQAQRQLELPAGQDHQARCRRNDRYDARQGGAHFAAGEFRPLPARSLERRSERPDDVGRFRCRLLCRNQRRHARHARDRARQARLRGRRNHDGRGDGAQRRPSHAQRGRRSAAGEPDDRRAAGRGASKAAGRKRLEHRRLSRCDVAPAARCAGAADAGPRHRRAMVFRRSRSKDTQRRA